MHWTIDLSNFLFEYIQSQSYVFPITAKPIPQVQNLAEQFPPKSRRPIVGIQSQGNGFQECIKAASLQQENTIPNTNRGREECRQGSTGEAGENRPAICTCIHSPPCGQSMKRSFSALGLEAAFLTLWNRTRCHQRLTTWSNWQVSVCCLLFPIISQPMYTYLKQYSPG